MQLRPIKPALMLFLIPYAFVSGLAYGLIAHKLVGEEEPWFTLVMLAALGITISLIAWPAGIAITDALWVFAGAGTLYLALRLWFGRRFAAELLGPVQAIAVLALLCWPT